MKQLNLSQMEEARGGFSYACGIGWTGFGLRVGLYFGGLVGGAIGGTVGAIVGATTC